MNRSQEMNKEGYGRQPDQEVANGMEKKVSSTRGNKSKNVQKTLGTKTSNNRNGKNPRKSLGKNFPLF